MRSVKKYAWGFMAYCAGLAAGMIGVNAINKGHDIEGVMCILGGIVGFMLLSAILEELESEE